MKIPINTRYIGFLLIILSIVLALIMYNFSETMLEIIDSGEIGTCQSMDACPHVTVLNQAYLGYFVALVVFLVGIFLVIFGGKPEASESNGKKWEDNMKTMSGDEKEIYGKIIAADGVIFQSELVDQSGFPKAKVSRILDKMEAKGLLERKRRGMANAVVLK